MADLGKQHLAADHMVQSARFAGPTGHDATRDAWAVTPPEILAPAGGPEAFFAALHAGADAVYLGLEGFNARARAQNFDADSLAQHLPIARRYGLKVLVALNILIKDVELPALTDALVMLSELDVHALIVQDLGLVAYCREHFPGLRLHASTQMAIHNAAGVAQARELGLRRVVLARELMAAELRRIRSRFTPEEMELEVFCHGSLCYAYSGLCFFSGAEDARSGNRGECAYTCRKPYRIVSEEGGGFLFSMKDLNTLDHIGTLVGTGVDALKIEGRKKDAQYVMTTVEAYRRALDAHFGYPTLRANAPAVAHELHRPGQSHETLRATRANMAMSFSREATTFFLLGRYHENVIDLNNPTHTGAAAGVLEAVGYDRTAGEVAITFTTAMALERFDGLRVVPESPQNDAARRARYRNEDMSFSARELFVDGRRVTSVAPGQRVTVSLPAEAAALWQTLLHPGLTVLKTRSSALRARTESLAHPLAGERLRAERLFDIKIEIAAADQDDSSPADDSTALDVTTVLIPVTQAHLPQNVMVPILRHTERLRAMPARNTTAPVATTGTPAGTAAGLEADLRATLVTFDEGKARARRIDFDVSGDVAVALSSLFVPRSLLKELRRNLNAALSAALAAQRESLSHRLRATLQVPARPLAARDPEPPRLHLKIDRRSYLPALASHRGTLRDAGLAVGDLVVEIKRNIEGGHDPKAWINAWLEDVARHDLGPLERLRFALPTVIRGWDEPQLERLVKGLWQAGVRRFEVGNLGALQLLRSWGLMDDGTHNSGLSLTADFTLFALNRWASGSLAAMGFERVALSIEDDAADIRSHLDHWPAVAAVPEAILYKDTPLFIAESCSLTALHGGCPSSAVCGYRSLTIEDEDKNRFHVAHEACKSIVYAERAFGITHGRQRLTTWGITNFRVDFLTRPYTDTAIADVLRAVASGQPAPASHSANFDGSLL